jgi:hypothetical protein
MLMIGVSTAQNITNLIPAVQKNIRISKFLILETSTAQKCDWSSGLISVLKSRNIADETLNIAGIDSNILEIKKKVLDKLKTHIEPVMWNLGGGQKPQQIPLWEIFKARNEIQIKDVVCYANQDVRDYSLLEFWEFDANNQLHRRTEEIEVDLRAEEIFRVFGFEVKEKTLIYSRRSNVSFAPVTDLMRFKEFRQYLFELPKRNVIAPEAETKYSLEEIAQILKNKRDDINKSLLEKFEDQNFQALTPLSTKSDCLRAFLTGKSDQPFGKIIDWLKEPPTIKKIPITDSKLKTSLGYDANIEEMEVTPVILELLKTGLKKTSDYFEIIVAQRIRDLLQSTTHKIIEAYSNLKIARVGNEAVVAAEYDVLCVTNKGTIIALDAKTFDFENKDIDARLYNLEQGSGFYRTFSPVIPLDFEDVDEEYLPKELIKLTLKMLKKKMNFFVLSDSTPDDSFWIRINADSTVEKSRTKRTENGWIECKALNNVFK